MYHGMRQTVCSGVGLLVAVLLVHSAWAESGWYAGIKGGIGAGSAPEGTVVGAHSDSSGDLTTEVGPVVLGSVGRGLGQGFRLEGEFSWRRNGAEDFTANTIVKRGEERGRPLYKIEDVEEANRLKTDRGETVDRNTGEVLVDAQGAKVPKHDAEGNPLYEMKDVMGRRDPMPVDGALTNLAVMLNGLYDWTTGGGSSVYVLGGIGLSVVSADGSQAALGSIDDTTTALAYQAGLGFVYPLTQQVAVDLSYRFFGTPDVDFDGLEVENRHHNVLFGVMYAF